MCLVSVQNNIHCFLGGFFLGYLKKSYGYWHLAIDYFIIFITKDYHYCELMLVFFP